MQNLVIYVLHRFDSIMLEVLSISVLGAYLKCQKFGHNHCPFYKQCKNVPSLATKKEL